MNIATTSALFKLFFFFSEKARVPAKSDLALSFVTRAAVTCSEHHRATGGFSIAGNGITLEVDSFGCAVNFKSTLNNRHLGLAAAWGYWWGKMREAAILTSDWSAGQLSFVDVAIFLASVAKFRRKQNASVWGDKSQECLGDLQDMVISYLAQFVESYAKNVYPLHHNACAAAPSRRPGVENS